LVNPALTTEKSSAVWIIRISGLRDEDGSAAQLCGELTDLRQEIEWNEDVQVVIITGASAHSFSMETDLKAPARGIDNALGGKFLQIADLIAALDRPVIAAINGDATGQGLEAMLACDIRIAANTCRFGLPHVAEGVMPWDGGTQRLSRIVGKANALELVLTAKIVDAQEALRIGLINSAVSSEAVLPAALQVGKEIASKGPIAVRYIKEAVQKGMDLTLDQGLRLEADLYLSLHTTTDRTEGIEAFRNKRKPLFRGQ
jgi:enoyl-CoA hydratase/carnithine racemase